MATSIAIEIESGTSYGITHEHNGYFAGSFVGSSSQPRHAVTTWHGTRQAMATSQQHADGTDSGTAPAWGRTSHGLR